MSGRKDFSYRLTAARRAREQAESAARAVLRAEAKQQREDSRRRHLETERQKAAEVAQRLAELRQRTQDDVERISSIRTEKCEEVQASIKSETEERLSDQAAKNRASVESTKPALSDELLGMASELGMSDRTIQELRNAQRPEQASIRLLDACEDLRQLNGEIQSCQSNLTSRLEMLGCSQDVKHFAKDRLKSLQESASTLLNTEARKGNASERLGALQKALLEAEEIEAAAIETAEKFEQRNSVLKDILESLQEVGFFVQPPEYINSDRPDQAVIIRANRADQTMVAKVDLDSGVESDWQGVHGEYCTDTFFDYVRQMNLRGVEITSENPQLVPGLKQQSALTLPNSNDRRSGNE